MTKEKNQAELFQDANLEIVRRQPKKRFDMDRAIEDLVGVFCDPIIVYPSGWQDTMPGWIKERITIDRLLEQMKVTKGEEPTATDSEALAYIYPASMEFPMNHDWTQIYMYLASKVCGAEGKIVPDDIKVETLTQEQERELRRLKDWIYQTRRRHRQEKAAGIRKERKEAAVKEQEEKVGVQASIFDFK